MPNRNSVWHLKSSLFLKLNILKKNSVVQKECCPEEKLENKCIRDIICYLSWYLLGTNWPTVIHRTAECQDLHFMKHFSFCLVSSLYKMNYYKGILKLWKDEQIKYCVRQFQWAEIQDALKINLQCELNWFSSMPICKQSCFLFILWKGERGLPGPPGLPGETGIGLPGPKVQKFHLLYSMYCRIRIKTAELIDLLIHKKIQDKCGFVVLERYFVCYQNCLQTVANKKYILCIYFKGFFYSSCYAWHKLNSRRVWLGKNKFIVLNRN